MSTVLIVVIVVVVLAMVVALIASASRRKREQQLGQAQNQALQDDVSHHRERELEQDQR
jgi:type II secretory pathway pseudopilin PulG